MQPEDRRELLSACWFSLCDKDEYECGSSDADGAPVVVDLMDAAVAWPADFRALVEDAELLGPFRYRLDVCDTRAKWCSGVNSTLYVYVSICDIHTFFSCCHFRMHCEMLFGSDWG